MARGRNSKIGDETVAKNGYRYVRTSSGWRLKHHLVAEKKLGRLIDTKAELVVFLDKDRTNFAPSNIKVRPKNLGSSAKRKAQILARIADLEAELATLD